MHYIDDSDQILRATALRVSSTPFPQRLRDISKENLIPISALPFFKPPGRAGLERDHSLTRVSCLVEG